VLAAYHEWKEEQAEQWSHWGYEHEIKRNKEHEICKCDRSYTGWPAKDVEEGDTGFDSQTTAGCVSQFRGKLYLDGFGRGDRWRERDS
jgi:hypothetical protein